MLIAKPIFIRNDKKIILGKWETNRKEDLESLSKLVKAGKLKAVIGRVLPLEETIQGLSDLENGFVNGKIVIKIIQ